MNPTTVVYVHGIWVPGGELAFVKHRLQSQYELSGVLFSYPSVGGTLDDNADRLAHFIGERVSGRTHVIGHSLGGVLSLRMLARNPDTPVARVVCLGSPLRGSRAAAALNRHQWGKAILGKTITAGVIQEAANEWATSVTANHEVGVIAGTTQLGLGRIMTAFEGENDGTVAVSETRLAGIKDHITLPVSHTGLVLSRNVADQAAAFLIRGEFLRDS